MESWWQLLIGGALAALVLWCALCAALWAGYRRDRASLHDPESPQDPDSPRGVDALRVLPDLLRMLRRLTADRSLPLGVRAGPVLLLLYLLCPIDLVPDFIPVLGYADDAILAALVLRRLVRRAGPEPLARHWPGTPEGLRAVRRLAGI